MEESIRLRDEGPEDADFLYHLYASTRAAEMELTPWNDAQKETFLRMQFRLQSEHYHRYYPAAGFHVILNGDRAVGRLYVDRGPDQIRIMDISLMPEHRSRGIGGRFMRELLAEARAGEKPATLHVERNNPALRLYQRLGFELCEDKGVYLYLEWRPGSLTGAATADGGR